jgi:hypothetical protein
MPGLGDLQPFNTWGNARLETRLKRLLNTRSGHFRVSDELLLTTQSCPYRLTENQLGLLFGVYSLRMILQNFESI